MIQAKKQPIERLRLADLGLAPEFTVPTQEVTSIEFATERQAGALIEDSAAAPLRIVEFLRAAKVV